MAIYALRQPTRKTLQINKVLLRFWDKKTKEAASLFMVWKLPSTVGDVTSYFTICRQNIRIDGFVLANIAHLRDDTIITVYYYLHVSRVRAFFITV